MREIIIDENYFATPKTMVLGNSGEVASRKIKVIQPEVDGASCYIARFSVKNGSVFETEITDGVFTVPAVVLYEVGEGYMQWVARDTAGQLIAKSDLISYSVLRSLSDETTPVPVVEDTESAVSQIKEAYETAVHGLEQLNGYGTIAEVVQARRSAISNEICSSLAERIDYDITQLQSAIESGTAIDDLEISGGIINSNRGNSIYDDTGNRRGLLALGVGNTASGQYSVAMGGGNTASGQYSVAMGGSNNASDTYSVAIGGGNTASGDASVAMGSNNTVSSSNSVAMGSSNTVSSSSSVAIGGGNKAFSSHSVAMGGGNTASGSHSVAMGGGNTASGEFSVAMGVGNTASSMNSVAIGGGNKASGQYSVAMGQSNTANVDNQTVIGRYNAPDSTEEGEVQHAFIIGNGNSTESGATHLSNAMTVDWDGNLIMSGDVTATDTNKETISLLNIYNRLKNIEERLSALETT